MVLESLDPNWSKKLISKPNEGKYAVWHKSLGTGEPNCVPRQDNNINGKKRNDKWTI